VNKKEASEMKKVKTSVWTGIIAGFEQELRAEGKAENTVTTYLQAVRQFTEFHKDADSVNSISQKSVNEWLTGFDSRTGTMNLKKNAIRKFFGFLKSEYKFRKEIKIAVRNLPRPEPSYLTIEEQERLLRYARGYGEVSAYHVMVRVLLYTGIRVSSLIGLKFKDFEGSTMTLRETKSGGTKRKHLKADIARLLKAYVMARRQKYPLNEAPAGSEDNLFLTRYAGQFKPYTRQALNKIIKKMAKAVSITKRISPHTLRHSFSVRFLSRNGSLLSLKHYLDHKSISTTEIYTHISDERLQEELERL
jgi:integrase/recombinase XerD